MIHLEDQQLDKDCEEELADGIPQLDGNGYSTSESISVDEEASFTFVSNYAEEDINDALKELKDDNLVPNLPTLTSRVRVQPRSADHLCTVVLNIPASNFFCQTPSLSPKTYELTLFCHCPNTNKSHSIKMFKYY